MNELRYETGGPAPTIRRVVESEGTNKNDIPTHITLREGQGVRTVPRISLFRQYHETWAEARDYLIEQAHRELAHLQRQKREAEALLRRLRAMKYE